MKVLLAVHGFPPAARAGTELYTYYLASELVRQGMTVHVFHGDRTADTERCNVVDGISCWAVPLRARKGPSRLEPTNTEIDQQFAKLCKSLRPDLVHVNHLNGLSTNLPQIGQDAGCRVMFTLWDYSVRCPNVTPIDWWGKHCPTATLWKCASCCRARFSRLTWPAYKASEARPQPFLKRVLKEIWFQIAERPRAWWRLLRRQRKMRRLSGAVDRFLLPSQFQAEQLTKWGIPAEKMVLFTPACAELDYAEGTVKKPGRRLRFGYLGAGTYIKGMPVLLEAFRGFQDADLVIYGPLEECWRLQYADVLRQPNVRCVGPINDEQKAQLLPELDALLVTSVCHETGPLVVLEAFHAGVPVICSNIAAMTERVIDDVDGLHFDAGNPVDLRSTLSRCVREPDLLERLRRGIRKPKSIQEHVRNEILPLYESLCRPSRLTVAQA